MSDTPDPNQTLLKGHTNSGLSERFNQFYQNEHHAFLAKKAERLSSAVHIVSGFIAPGEPLRITLRTLAIDLAQASVDVRRFTDMGPQAFGSRCAEIGSLLATAQAAGLISSMNADMIIAEYAGLATFMRERYTLISGESPSVDVPVPPRVSRTLKDMSDSLSYSKPKGHASNSDRQKAIMSILSSKDRISINDVASVVSGVSEKTIQRELLAMVDQGLLVKEGERRWATYRKA